MRTLRFLFLVVCLSLAAAAGVRPLAQTTDAPRFEDYPAAVRRGPNIGGPREERYGPSGIHYYEWARHRLHLVRFTHVGSYPEADPPGRR